jgi:amino acid transporter
LELLDSESRFLPVSATVRCRGAPVRPWGLALADNPLYNGAVCLGILWFATLLNIVGLERAKWLQNAGAAAIWLVGALILCGGLLAWHRFGAATPIAASALLPDLR